MRPTNSNDTLVLLLSVVALLAATTLSVVTITAKPQTRGFELDDPTLAVRQAADAGSKAAKGHIQCHGRTRAGHLSSRYHTNGVTYHVQWDDVDLSDSTVVVKTTAEYVAADDRRYEASSETKIKLDFLPSHDLEILHDYYSQPAQLAAAGRE